MNVGVGERRQVGGGTCYPILDQTTNAYGTRVGGESWCVESSSNGAVCPNRGIVGAFGGQLTSAHPQEGRAGGLRLILPVGKGTDEFAGRGWTRSVRCVV